jgi:predicted DNA-binding ribbon-helix-helix protein
MGAGGDNDRPRLNPSAPRKRSVVIAGHATSLSLEEPFWRDLGEIARSRGLSLNALVAAVDAERSGNLSSALRLFVRACYRSGELGGAASHD